MSFDMNITDTINNLSESATEKLVAKERIRNSPKLKRKMDILSGLNPGKRAEILICEYVREKIRIAIIVAIFGTMLLIASVLSIYASNPISENLSLLRKDIGGGDYSMTLNAKTEEYEYGDIMLEINERKLSNEEVALGLNHLRENIETLIIGDNTSLSHVTSDLNLIKEVEGWPFTLTWSSSNYNLIRDNGKRGDYEPDTEGEDVILTAVVSYTEQIDEIEVMIRIFPRVLSTEEQQMVKLNEALLDVNRGSASKQEYYLPKEVDGNNITWRPSKDNTPILLLIMLILLEIGLWKGKDNDLSTKLKRRNDELLLQYSELICRLQVLLSSGMTIRGSLDRICADYQAQKKRGAKERYAYEELELCMRRISDGASEADSYKYLGERCNLMCYRKLASLLVQNLKKGNAGLIQALDSEVALAFNERKQVARRKGEEAQTKLMLPMMMMLTVVMIIIMVPALLSFSGM